MIAPLARAVPIDDIGDTGRAARSDAPAFWNFAVFSALYVLERMMRPNTLKARAERLRMIASTLTSTDVAALLEQYAAEMTGAAHFLDHQERARLTYARIQGYN